MSESKIQQRSSDSAQELGDETFMSATELRNYMVETVVAKASKDAAKGAKEEAKASKDATKDTAKSASDSAKDTAKSTSDAAESPSCAW